MDQEGQSEPVHCLRLIIHSSGFAFTLPLNKASSSIGRWERIGIEFANSSLVGLEKLSQAERETVTLYYCGIHWLSYLGSAYTLFLKVGSCCMIAPS